MGDKAFDIARNESLITRNTFMYKHNEEKWSQKISVFLSNRIERSNKRLKSFSHVVFRLFISFFIKLLLKT